MVDTFNDEVLNHYLEQKGYTIQKEFLCGSAFFIGWRIETPFFSLAYRLDEQELILCSFEARNQTGLNGPVLSLTRLLEELYHHFSGIKKISAMKSKIGSDSERQKREELFNYFIRKGAVQQETDSVPELLNSTDLVNDPEKMLELQFAVQQYSAYVNVESGMLKTIKDLVSTIFNRSF